MAHQSNVQWICDQLKIYAIHEQVSNKTGFSYDAAHFGVIYGKNASKQVWPRIARFLNEQRVQASSCECRTGKPQALNRSISQEHLRNCHGQAVSRLIENLFHFAENDVQ